MSGVGIRRGNRRLGRFTVVHTKQAESRKERWSERKTDRDRGDAISKSVLVGSAECSYRGADVVHETS